MSDIFKGVIKINVNRNLNSFPTLSEDELCVDAVNRTFQGVDFNFNNILYIGGSSGESNPVAVMTAVRSYSVDGSYGAIQLKSFSQSDTISNFAPRELCIGQVSMLGNIFADSPTYYSLQNGPLMPSGSIAKTYAVKHSTRNTLIANYNYRSDIHTGSASYALNSWNSINAKQLCLETDSAYMHFYGESLPDDPSYYPEGAVFFLIEE